MPDFDDFSGRRDEVIEYVSNTYGRLLCHKSLRLAQTRRQ